MIKKDNIYWMGTFSLKITGKCNLNCPHCFENGSKDIEMSTEVIDRLLDFSDKFEELHFTGGEPTLALNKMEYFLEEAKKRNVKIYSLNMTTNGTGFNQEFYDILYKYKCYIKQCLEDYLKKSISDECATTHIKIAISDDEYHKIDAVAAYKKAIRFGFDKVAFINLATDGNVVAQVGRGKKFGVTKIENFRVGKIGVSHRNTYCPYAEYWCKTEKDPTVMCRVELGHNGNLYANSYPREQYVICNIMNTDSILDAIDIWNDKNPSYCLELTELNKDIESVNIDKEIDMMCDKIKHDKNYELLGIDRWIDDLLYYEMYGDTIDKIKKKLQEMNPQEDSETFLWNQKHDKYADIHSLYPKLEYKECEELSTLLCEKVKNRKKILSLKYRNFIRRVENEIKFRDEIAQKEMLYHNALKKKYDSGVDPEILCQVWNEKFKDDIGNMDIQEFKKNMQFYREFTEEERTNALSFWFSKRINELKNDNVPEEKSLLIEDILLHYLAYCNFVKNTLSDKAENETVKKVIAVATDYISYLRDLLSLDILIFSSQNDKDQKLGRKPTFSDDELKDATDLLNNNMLLRLKYRKISYILNNLG